MSIIEIKGRNIAAVPTGNAFLVLPHKNLFLNSIKNFELYFQLIKTY